MSRRLSKKRRKVTLAEAPEADEGERQQLLVAVREIVRRAIITLAVVRDPDRRYLGAAQQKWNVVHDIQDAYGYSPPPVRNFQPTAYEISQMEVVMPWLAWLRREEGELSIRRIIGWAMGVQMWRIGRREECSERTVMNRIDRSMSVMIERFFGAEIRVERIDEPYKSTPYALVFDRPMWIGDPVLIRKVYVGGLGMVRGGKRLRGGTTDGVRGKVAA